MKIQEQISAYINSLPDSKKTDLLQVHNFILEIMPSCKLWYLDGKDEKGKVVSNPNIGYGLHIIKYANGSRKEFYQIGLSANTTGISVYIMGIKDKSYLPKQFGEKIGKATVTGYCIKFRALKDINLTILNQAIRYGLMVSG
jgi:hypothetical protein